MKASFLALVLFAAALTACTSNIKQTDRLAQVKKVAIIALDLQQQKSVSTEDLFDIATKQVDNSAKPTLRAEAKHLDAIYADTANKIARKMSWQVMDHEKMINHPAYVKLFKEKTEGWQNRPAINARYDLYSPSKVLDSFAIMTTKPTRLQELAKELKVDAVIVTHGTVNLNNNSALASMVGKGEFRPNAALSMHVHDGVTGEKIFMTSVEGPKLEKGEKNTVGMANVDNLNRMAQEATALSVNLALEKLAL